MKFNEKYTFHHYDMSTCAEAKKVGLSIGVYPIFPYSSRLENLHNDTWNKLAIEFGQDYKDYKSSYDYRQQNKLCVNDPRLH